MSVGDEITMGIIDAGIEELSAQGYLDANPEGVCKQHPPLVKAVNAQSHGISLLLKIERVRLHQNNGTVVRKPDERDGSAPAPARTAKAKGMWSAIACALTTAFRNVPPTAWVVLFALLGALVPVALFLLVLFDKIKLPL